MKSYVITENVELARMLVLRKGLKLELIGLKVSRGQTLYSRIKEEFGLKGTRKSVYEQFDKIVEAALG
jgi:hypothetical protein